MTAVAEPILSPALASSQARTRLHYGDPIRIIGTIAVIVGHVCDMELFRYEAHKASGTLLDWWVCCVLDVMSRWAVPVFLMLSGALLLAPTSQTPAQFYKRRFSRVGVATAFWSAVFMWFAVWYLPESWGQHWMRVANNLLLGQPYAHMHFLFRIVGLYLFTPALRVFVRHADRRMLVATVILCFAVAGGNSVVSVLIGAQPNAFSRFVPFLGYYLAGYALRDVRVTRRGLALAWAGFIVTTALVSWSVGHLLGRFGQASPTITGEGLALDPVFAAYPVAHLGLEFLNPVRIVMGLCVWFIFVGTFQNAPPQRQPWTWLSKVAAPSTLGLYLVHPLFRDVMAANGYTAGIIGGPLGTWLGVPLQSLLVLLPSLALTLVLMYNPLLRKIVGGDEIPVETRRGKLIAAASLVVVVTATVILICATRPPRQTETPSASSVASTTAPAMAPSAFPGEPAFDPAFHKASIHRLPMPGPTVKPPAPATQSSLEPSAHPPTKHGHYRQVLRATIDGKEVRRPYLIYLPEGYDAASAKRWPLLLFLHGGWEGGADYELLMLHGPPKLVEFHPTLRAAFPFILLTPQCEYDRGFEEPDMAAAALSLIDDVVGRFPVDRSRIYATGLSIGGAGVWKLASMRPDLFAAIAPLCAKDSPAVREAASRVTKSPVFTAVGLNDYQEFIQGARELVRIVRSTGGSIELREMPDMPHDVWTGLYATREFYGWLLKHQRR